MTHAHKIGRLFLVGASWSGTRLLQWLFFFFQSTRTDQNSSWKFYKILLHQIALFGLANWTKKVFPLFPRNIPYRARPHFNFFRHCETFFESPFNFFGTFQCFLALWDFFSKFFFLFSAPGARTSGPRRATRSNFFDFSIFEYCKLTLGCPFAIFEPWIWRRLGPVPACSF